jgi:hypothetical protein
MSPRKKKDARREGEKKDVHRLFLSALFDIRAQKIHALLDELISSGAVIPERTMRTLRLKAKLRSVPDELVVEILNTLMGRTDPGDVYSAMLIVSMVDIYSCDEKNETQKLLKLYVICRDRGYEWPANLFVSPTPKQKPFNKYDFVEDQEEDYITLGEKRSLARTNEKDLLDRLLYDPNPLVIKNVLENPRMTERDVIKIVSRRPNYEDVLTTVYLNDKWLSSYSIKRAIIKNPYTPVGIALGLLFFLNRQDLRDVSTDLSLHDVITSMAQDLLKRKRGGLVG